MNFKFRNYYLCDGRFITSYSTEGGTEIRVGLPARKIVYSANSDFGIKQSKLGYFSQEIPFAGGTLRSYGYDVVKG